MVLAKKAVTFSFFLLVIFSQKSKAHVYTVGDFAGWTNIGNFDYKTWAATKTFQVGDIILFEYNKQFHNVVRVSHKDFNSCNSTGALATFTSGYDLFVIYWPGHYYFICDFPGHCESGQKVDIRVPPPPLPNSSSPTPAYIWPSPFSPGKASPAPAPAPSPSSGLMLESFWLSTLIFMVSNIFLELSTRRLISS